ncbi:hypothetical protein GGTG_07826 [Gaeumannomyces tritici R3-111a-1]|uniref:Uncharacterized protein n=1 Tax=Gaeumannomyces tritici (strain R3-111a-1) TaxID=644352 RepID=J3P2T4_GAET3|nr:hypothetical protein GGTG_07826 [Gaeumannomyces tritici R3-111a-1]EJT73976.1 hypothetical protein GGTG_07826 [Gaeumannomyces tritici R3-111a-1]
MAWMSLFAARAKALRWHDGAGEPSWRPVRQTATNSRPLDDSSLVPTPTLASQGLLHPRDIDDQTLVPEESKPSAGLIAGAAVGALLAVLAAASGLVLPGPAGGGGDDPQLHSAHLLLGLVDDGHAPTEMEAKASPRPVSELQAGFLPLEMGAAPLGERQAHVGPVAELPADAVGGDGEAHRGGDEALKEAQKLGDTPELCADPGKFMLDVDQCVGCVDEQPGTSPSILRMILPQDLEGFFLCCEQTKFLGEFMAGLRLNHHRAQHKQCRLAYYRKRHRLTHQHKKYQLTYQHKQHHPAHQHKQHQHVCHQYQRGSEQSIASSGHNSRVDAGTASGTNNSCGGIEPRHKRSLARGHPADGLVPYVVYCTKTDAFAPSTGPARQLALGLSKRRPVSTATGLPAVTRAANLNATGWTAVAKAVDLGPSTGESKSLSKEESFDVLADAVMAAPAGAAAVAILAVGVAVFYRRRRRIRKRKKDRPEGGGGGDIEDKPQLHSDHLPRVDVQEMDAWQPPGELAGVQPPRLAELPAKEPAATEMAASSDGQR